jgi:hypothetical protein
LIVRNPTLSAKEIKDLYLQKRMFQRWPKSTKCIWRMLSTKSWKKGLCSNGRSSFARVKMLW